jgi:hypothetical protein
LKIIYSIPALLYRHDIIAEDKLMSVPQEEEKYKPYEQEIFMSTELK